MVLIFFYFKFKKVIQNYQLKNLFIIFIVGLFLGMIAAFLGVGGGPFNVAILSLFFSMNAKDASANSIFIIFFSQLSSLITTQVTTGFSTFDLGFLPFMVIGGVLGGFIGSILLNKVNNKHVEQIFSIGVILIFLLNAYNIIKLVV